MENLYQQIITEWQKSEIKTEAAIESRLSNFKVLFAYHSGKIENPEINYHDTREIFDESRVSSFTGNIRTLFEQQNQKECYEFLKSKIVAKEPLTAELIKKIHYELCKGTYDERRYSENGERPGEYKKHDYIIGINEVGEPPERVDAAMRELLQEVSLLNSENVLKAACYLHAVFENIHPFADGNGRVGRTVMNYFLMINNHPPVTVREEDRKEYYNALEAFDTYEDLSPLESFMQAECVKTWQRQKQNIFQTPEQITENILEKKKGLAAKYGFSDRVVGTVRYNKKDNTSSSDKIKSSKNSLNQK